jgi:uncharacterized protein (TIGR03118 family)
MNTLYRSLALTVLIGHYLIFAAHAQTGGYIETDLVVNKQVGGVPALVDSNGIKHVAKFVDEKLVNPWGIAESATSPFWISDGGAGVATLYNTAGAPQPLIVSLPSPSNPLGTDSIPTGAVFNNLPAAQGAFPLSGVSSSGTPVTAPAVFLFATKNGTILGWNPSVNPEGFDPAKAGKYAIVVVNHSPFAAYTGLAMATDTNGTTRLYAPNFGAGTVDVFDTSNQVFATNAFADPSLPHGFAPFNIAPITVNGSARMFVTYALQNLTKLAGQGSGIVNTFQLDGTTPQRFTQHNQLVAAWGLALAPAGFGELGGALWIGNFGDGRINAFDSSTGRFIGKVRTPDNQAIVIDGRWSIMFGNGGNGGSVSTLYFTAGPNSEQDGLFGSLDPH